MKDVKVTVVQACNTAVHEGDYFIVKGDKIHAPGEQGVCFYSLSALMPFFAAWQMDPGSTDHFLLNVREVKCPMGKTVYKAETCESLTLEGLK